MNNLSQNKRSIYNITGVVEKHLGRGKKLGYPTANISCPGDIPDGLYVGYVTYDTNTSNALIFIGSSLTFGETEKKCESHLLDFNGDLYGKEIRIQVMKKLRNNIQFRTAKELQQQMKKDEDDTRAYFAL
jgi:riboflavin kinase/FMN adenylyltransferase